MFEGMKNMAGLAGLMKDLPRIKAEMEAVKARLGELRVSSETGGGAVSVTATGKIRIESIVIDQAMLSALVDSSNPEDKVLAEELIAGAVNAALEKAQRAAAEEFAKSADDLGIPLPGSALEGLI